MVDYFVVVVIVAFILVSKFPLIYASVKADVISGGIRLENEDREVCGNCAYALSCLLPSMIIYYLSQDLWLSCLMILLGIVAYTDLMARWVPDCLIYAISWVSLMSGSNHSIEEGILSVVLFVFPMALFQVIAFIRQGTGSIANGDFYLFPPIALWLAPEYSALVMLVSLGSAIIVSRFVKDVPFITCLLPVFVGYQICAMYFIR